MSDFNCVDPSNNYAVLIIVNADSGGKIEPTSIDFSVNGNISNITFTEIGSKIIPITLIEGENTVQLITSGSTHTVQLITPPEFEIVF